MGAISRRNTFWIKYTDDSALAKGTSDWQGGLVQISERGGEIVDLPKGSRVYPHDESVSIAKNTSNAKLSALDRRLAKVEAGKGGKNVGKKRSI